jgi:CubicO group peptidase (beta-lactamase class C family)
MFKRFLVVILAFCSFVVGAGGYARGDIGRSDLQATGLFSDPESLRLYLVYMTRALMWGESDVRDYKKFPEHVLLKESAVFNFEINIDPALFETVKYTYQGIEREADLNRLLQTSGTTAFIVIQDDVILFEDYFNGYERDSINTSFSVAKSFASTLVGIAIDEGYIEGVEEPITTYLPELVGAGFENITIGHLLSMASGIKYDECCLLRGDDSLTYYYPDLRKLALENTFITKEIGVYFHYNNYHTLLIGLILERATGMDVAEYLEEKIWKQLGMEFDASWSIDSTETGFAKMESGINARAIDFAKFGRLLLEEGMWNGSRIISETWVNAATAPVFQAEEAADNNTENYQYLLDNDFYYKYFWWGLRIDDANYDFFARGKYGQTIYISPRKNAVVVRFGSRYGPVDSWPLIIRDIVESLPPSTISRHLRK